MWAPDVVYHEQKCTFIYTYMYYIYICILLFLIYIYIEIYLYRHIYIYVRSYVNAHTGHADYVYLHLFTIFKVHSILYLFHFHACRFFMNIFSNTCFSFYLSIAQCVNESYMHSTHILIHCKYIMPYLYARSKVSSLAGNNVVSCLVKRCVESGVVLHEPHWAFD